MRRKKGDLCLGDGDEDIVDGSGLMMSRTITSP
jgi:hypothetical protein